MHSMIVILPHVLVTARSVVIIYAHQASMKKCRQLNTAQRNAQAGRATTPSTTPTAPAQTTPPAQNMPQGQNMPQTMPTMVSPMWTTKTGTIASVQDPGQGHENHQLAVILPPSDKIYSGVISWTSSEPLQIVELTGPLGQGDDKGQPIWTTDGKTKFALTLVNVNQTTGRFSVTSNALAVHYPYPIAF